MVFHSHFTKNNWQKCNFFMLVKLQLYGGKTSNMCLKLILFLGHFCQDRIVCSHAQGITTSPKMTFLLIFEIFFRFWVNIYYIIIFECQSFSTNNDLFNYLFFPSKAEEHKLNSCVSIQRYKLNFCTKLEHCIKHLWIKNRFHPVSWRELNSNFLINLH